MQPGHAVKTRAIHELLPSPSLEERHLKEESAHAPEIGPLSALVPADGYSRAPKNAPALVLIPGLGMDGMGFLRQLPLGGHADLHFFQTPNAPLKNEDGLYRFAGYVEAYIAARGLDKRPGGVVLGGCSMGGAISLAIAIRGRVKLRGLVLIGTFGSCQHLPKWQRVAAPLAWVLPFRVSRKIAKQVVARTPFFGTITPDEASWLVACKIRRSQSYFGWAIDALTKQEQIEAAAKLKVPTLVLHGTRDKVLPYEAGVQLAETIPGAKLVTVKDAGHALFFTNHEPVNQAIAEFLRGLR